MRQGVALARAHDDDNLTLADLVLFQAPVDPVSQSDRSKTHAPTLIIPRTA
jgi:hypothetical protein